MILKKILVRLKTLLSGVLCQITNFGVALYIKYSMVIYSYIIKLNLRVPIKIVLI